jgi:hypothetical protein
MFKESRKVSQVCLIRGVIFIRSASFPYQVTHVIHYLPSKWPGFKSRVVKLSDIFTPWRHTFIISLTEVLVYQFQWNSKTDNSIKEERYALDLRFSQECKFIIRSSELTPCSLIGSYQHFGGTSVRSESFKAEKCAKMCSGDQLHQCRTTNQCFRMFVSVIRVSSTLTWSTAQEHFSKYCFHVQGRSWQLHTIVFSVITQTTTTSR